MMASRASALYALALLAGAAPAVAGCFNAEALPARAIYEGGTQMDYLGLADGVLTYRSGKVTSRLINGLLPLDHKTDGFEMEYHWEGEAPTFETLRASVDTLVIQGKRQVKGKAMETVSAELTFLGDEVVDWEDCRYTPIRFRKIIKVGGKKESEGTLLLAPGPMISFESESVELATGQTYSYSLKSLE